MGVLPKQDVFYHDLLEGETIINEFQVYITPSEVPPTATKLILYSILTLGLYAIYMLLLHPRWHPKELGGYRAKLVITSKARMLIWTSDLKATLASDAGGCFNTSSLGIANTKLATFLLSDISSIERIYMSSSTCYAHSCAKLRLTFGSYALNLPQDVIYPEIITFKPTTEYTTLYKIWSTIVSYLPHIWTAALYLPSSCVIEVQSILSDQSLTTVRGARDQLHPNANTVHAEMVQLERMILWGKNADDAISTCSTHHSNKDGTRYVVSDTPRPLIERNKDGLVANINTVAVPLNANEEIGISILHVITYIGQLCLY